VLRDHVHATVGFEALARDEEVTTLRSAAAERSP
jgi:hypothetical protein